jgi:NAD(P)-dependent dehydrogenase (short-subunit alcohol dehydrogenase family)
VTGQLLVVDRDLFLGQNWKQALEGRGAYPTISTVCIIEHKGLCIAIKNGTLFNHKRLQMETDLKGKVALVTGCSGTIGRAVALLLAEHGVHIVVHYGTREKEARAIAKEIEARDAKAVVICANVGVFEEVQGMIRMVLHSLGPIDILVNCASGHRSGKVYKLPIEDWDLVVKSALYGTFYCCRTVLPSMLERGWGRIVNISSLAGEYGYPGDSAYASAKAGLVAFTKSLAREVAGYGITANIVTPGFIPSETTKTLTERNIEKIRAAIPMGRFGKPEEVADVVMFLIAKGDYVTGSIYHVDGGLKQ